jgi:steroid 5-alpha reductase family enzyme|tara:strand:+ start:1894 stop:2733 length:840 start_codon:yes stop_codon:yes gene_type:complete
MNNILANYIISFVAVLISVSLGILTGIDEVRNGIILSFIFHWLLFIPAFIYKTEKFYDLTGSLSYITIIFYVLVSSYNGVINFGNIILSLLIIIWTLRLGTFLFLRIKKAGEDKRFREIKKSFSWFFMAFTFSGMWVSICALCALTGISNGIELTGVTYIGILLFVIGLTLEIIADTQKTNFRKIKDNEDKFITTGLWKYSRHPNYLGEIILWIGVAIISYSSLEINQLFTLISPIFTYLLLVYVSGINLLEKSGEKKWGNLKEYRKYKKETPRLFWFI